MVTLLLALQPAFAWKHLEPPMAWDVEDFPRHYAMDDDVETSLPEGYDEEVVEKSWQNWEVESVACAGLAHVYDGRSDRGSPSRTDGDSIVYWDDPSDLADVGVLGVTYPQPEGVYLEINGERYAHLLDADIVFNNDIDWGTTDDIAAGICASESAVEGVATHEIGHSWGMGHSCDEGEECADEAKRGATMFWQVGACDLSQVDIGTDDAEGISALYGPYGTFTSTTDRFGGNPLEVCFAAESESEITSVVWNFGDGEASTEVEPCHTYTLAGQFTVSASMTLTDDQCGGANITYRYSELGYVRSCNAPQPSEGSEGFFKVDHFDGLTYQIVNFSDVSVYGCIDAIRWQVFRGSTAADMVEANLVDFNGDANGGEEIGAWAPKLEFPSEGSYVVRMDVGGPGGESANFLVVDAQDTRGETVGGCATAPGSLVGLGGLLLAATFGLRRRR